MDDESESNLNLNENDNQEIYLDQQPNSIKKFIQKQLVVFLP